MRADETALRAVVAAHRANHLSSDGPAEGPPAALSRREAIKRVSAALGGAVVIGQSAWLGGCTTSRPGARSAGDLFLASDVELLDEIADTILPETSTPGAKAAAVGPFIVLMVADTYTVDEQRTFADGLMTIDAESLDAFGATFLGLSAAQRTQLLERLDREQYDYMRTRSSGQPTHYFRMIKQLTLLGYFTSEIGVTQAQRYREAPGRFDPCVPYTPGERSWAAHA